MVTSAHIFILVFTIFSVIILDRNHAAVRERRSLLLFGKSGDSGTTTRTIAKGPLGILSLSVGGGQKAPQDPCNPYQDPQPPSGSKRGLIDVKIPSIFNRGRSQPTTVIPECATVSVATSASPLPASDTTVATEKLTQQPLPTFTISTTSPALPSSPSSSHQTSSSSSSTAVDHDQELIDSIFGEEAASTTTENYGAGHLDFRRPLS